MLLSVLSVGAYADEVTVWIYNQEDTTAYRRAPSECRLPVTLPRGYEVLYAAGMPTSSYYRVTCSDSGLAQNVLSPNIVTHVVKAWTNWLSTTTTEEGTGRNRLRIRVLNWSEVYDCDEYLREPHADTPDIIQIGTTLLASDIRSGIIRSGSRGWPWTGNGDVWNGHLERGGATNTHMIVPWFSDIRFLAYCGKTAASSVRTMGQPGGERAQVLRDQLVLLRRPLWREIRDGGVSSDVLYDLLIIDQTLGTERNNMDDWTQPDRDWSRAVKDALHSPHTALAIKGHVSSSSPTRPGIGMIETLYQDGGVGVVRWNDVKAREGAGTANPGAKLVPVEGAPFFLGGSLLAVHQQSRLPEASGMDLLHLIARDSPSLTDAGIVAASLAKLPSFTDDSHPLSIPNDIEDELRAINKVCDFWLKKEYSLVLWYAWRALSWRVVRVGVVAGFVVLLLRLFVYARLQILYPAKGRGTRIVIPLWPQRQLRFDRVSWAVDKKPSKWFLSQVAALIRSLMRGDWPTSTGSDFSAALFRVTIHHGYWPRSDRFGFTVQPHQRLALDDNQNPQGQDSEIGCPEYFRILPDDDARAVDRGYRTLRLNRKMSSVLPIKLMVRLPWSRKWLVQMQHADATYSLKAAVALRDKVTGKLGELPPDLEDLDSLLKGTLKCLKGLHDNNASKTITGRWPKRITEESGESPEFGQLFNAAKRDSSRLGHIGLTVDDTNLTNFLVLNDAVDGETVKFIDYGDVNPEGYQDADYAKFFAECLQDRWLKSRRLQGEECVSDFLEHEVPTLLKTFGDVTSESWFIHLVLWCAFRHCRNTRCSKMIDRQLRQEFLSALPGIVASVDKASTYATSWKELQGPFTKVFFPTGTAPVNRS